MDLHLKKKLEIVVERPLLSRLEKVLDNAGVTGWTVMPAVQGRGDFGTWVDSHLTDATNHVVLVTVTGPQRADQIMEEIAPFLAEHSLILYVSDVRVVRPDRF